MRWSLFCSALLLPAFTLAQADSSRTPPAPTSPVPTSIASADPQPSAPIIQDVVLDRANRMRIPVTVNTKGPYYFLVDTGSEATIISNQLAATLSLVPERKLRIAGMAGASERPAFRLDILQMDALALRGLLAASLDERDVGAAGIIGIDTLQKHKVIFDFRRGLMEVLPSKRLSKAKPAKEGEILVEATRRAGRLILTNATIAGRKVDLVVDSGAQSSVGNLALRDALIGKGARGGEDRMQMVQLNSVTGDSITAQSTVIPRIRIGGMEFQDIPINYANGYAFRILNLDKKPAMLLGMDTLQLFDRIEVDFANRRVRFTLPAGGSPARRLDGMAASL
jgi:predicted aspartyl protease